MNFPISIQLVHFKEDLGAAISLLKRFWLILSEFHGLIEKNLLSARSDSLETDPGERNPKEFSFHMTPSEQKI